MPRFTNTSRLINVSRLALLILGATAVVSFADDIPQRGSTLGRPLQRRGLTDQCQTGACPLTVSGGPQRGQMVSDDKIVLVDPLKLAIRLELAAELLADDLDVELRPYAGTAGIRRDIARLISQAAHLQVSLSDGKATLQHAHHEVQDFTTSLKRLDRAVSGLHLDRVTQRDFQLTATLASELHVTVNRLMTDKTRGPGKGKSEAPRGSLPLPQPAPVPQSASAPVPVVEQRSSPPQFVRPQRSSNLPAQPSNIGKRAVAASPPQIPTNMKGIAQLPVAQQAAALAQRTCPVTGELLGAHGKPLTVNVQGRTVFVCCRGCVQDLKANPAKYL